MGREREENKLLVHFSNSNDGKTAGLSTSAVSGAVVYSTQHTAGKGDDGESRISNFLILCRNNSNKWRTILFGGSRCEHRPLKIIHTKI